MYQGKSLEEIDAIFEQPFNPFKQRQIEQRAAEIARQHAQRVEMNEVDARRSDSKFDQENVENTV